MVEDLATSKGKLKNKTKMLESSRKELLSSKITLAVDKNLTLLWASDSAGWLSICPSQPLACLNRVAFFRSSIQRFLTAFCLSSFLNFELFTMSDTRK